MRGAAACLCNLLTGISLLTQRQALGLSLLSLAGGELHTQKIYLKRERDRQREREREKSRRGTEDKRVGKRRVKEERERARERWGERERNILTVPDILSSSLMASCIAASK